jgi:hypothetical protein
MDLQSLEDWLVAASAPLSSNSPLQASAKQAPGPLPAARLIAEVRIDRLLSQVNIVAQKI